VAYLPHARKVEPPNQPFLSSTRTSNGIAGLRNPFLGYGSVNTLPRRRMMSHSNSTGWESRDRVSSDPTRFNNDATIDAPLEGAFPACQIKGLQERPKLVS
jgi:hypothetical protein